jgi:ubiquinone/menaquinone biosynthesis C-methylase UbiE
VDRNQVNAIYDRYSGLPVQRWRTDLIGSIDRRCVDGIDFPGMPPEDLQRHLQGNSNEIALRGALAFREHCVRVLESNDYPLGKDSVLLDFGSGWGRIARAFMRDVPASNIFGLEPFDFILEARKANTFINFVQTSPLPPLPFRDGFATHIVTWSTFTHFNEDFFVQWLAEFARVLRPNGVCFITTLGISFLNNLQKARAAKAAGEEPHFWIDLILKRITADEVESAKQRIATGEFVWLASTQVARAEFAECFVTDAYVRRRFGDLFEVISYAADGELAQDCIALRRRPS